MTTWTPHGTVNTPRHRMTQTNTPWTNYRTLSWTRRTLMDTLLGAHSEPGKTAYSGVSDHLHIHRCDLTKLYLCVLGRDEA